jgi:glycosyltransferase involved in cell wall biosynthesis
MRIGIVGSLALPTSAESLGGLEQSSYELALGLARRGHAITLFAWPGSQFEQGQLVSCTCEDDYLDHLKSTAFDAIIDCDHPHAVSRRFPRLPVLNRIGDRECEYEPPNAVVATEYMRRFHPRAHVIATGIDAAAIPFVPSPDSYLIFIGYFVEHKNWKGALAVAKSVGRPIKFIGLGGNRNQAPGYLGVVRGAQKWRLIGRSCALLAPYRMDAAPRAPLEAAACGTPTLCLDGDGTHCQVAPGVSGFVASDLELMASQLDAAIHLDRRAIRAWVEAAHPLHAMLDAYESLWTDLARRGS